MRYLGGLTVDFLAANDGSVSDVFSIGNGPTFREVARIVSEDMGYRVYPAGAAMDGWFKDYREAFMYVMMLGKNA